MLEQLETEYEGRFKLAKLNSDDQPEIAGQLSQMFGVRSIPFCVLFKDGQPVDGFVGALPAAEVRTFLDKHVPSSDALSAEEEVEEAEALLADGDTDSAIAKLQEALVMDPANDTARYDCLRALLGAGRIEEARRAYDPVATQVMLDPRLAAAGHWLAACEKAAVARTPEELSAAIAANKRDFEARFEVAQVHFAAQEFTEALDALLEIVMRDKAWNGEIARKNLCRDLGPDGQAGADEERGGGAQGQARGGGRGCGGARRSFGRRVSAQVEHGVVLKVEADGIGRHGVFANLPFEHDTKWDGRFAGFVNLPWRWKQTLRLAQGERGGGVAKLPFGLSLSKPCRRVAAMEADLSTCSGRTGWDALQVSPTCRSG